MGRLEPAIRAVEETFLEAVRLHTATTQRQVMLGDATVTTQDTFDAAGVGEMFGRVAAGLDGWQAREVTTTTNEDIRRVFVKFSTLVDGYSMTGHFSLQFHVLLYYVPEQRVIDCQRDLARVIDEAKAGEAQMADASDDIVSEGVRTKGEDDISEMEIFERLYRDESLVKRAGVETGGRPGCGPAAAGRRETASAGRAGQPAHRGIPDGAHSDR